MPDVDVFPTQYYPKPWCVTRGISSPVPGVQLWNFSPNSAHILVARSTQLSDTIRYATSCKQQPRSVAVVLIYFHIATELHFGDVGYFPTQHVFFRTSFLKYLNDKDSVAVHSRPCLLLSFVHEYRLHVRLTSAAFFPRCSLLLSVSVYCAH